MTNKNPKLSYVYALTNFYHSDVFERLMTLGSDAVVMYLMLRSEIFNTNYMIEYDKSVELYVADRMVLSTAEVRAYLQQMVKMELFDPYLLKKHRLLTSQAIQTTYMESTIKLKRKSVFFSLHHILVPMNKRKEFHMAISENDPQVVVMYDVATYQKICSLRGNQTDVQEDIENVGKALVEWTRRVEKRGLKEGRKKEKKRLLLFADDAESISENSDET